MSATWEVQKAIYTTLSSDSTFMNKIGSRIYDEPPVDETYPFVTIGSMSEIKFNKISSIGYEILANISIYTKSGRLGYKTAKEILVEINRLLNRKKLTLDTLKMIQIYYNNSDTIRDEETRIINTRYTILIEE